jgi:hypothetical protein
MRKLLVTVVASCALVAVVPASALAHGHHHARHHGRIHHKTFGSDWSQSGSSTSGSTTTGSGDTAGTVQSFTNGVLTILLNDQKTTVTGQVTNGTEIECGAPDMSGSSGWQGHDHGGDNTGANNTTGGDNNGGGSQGDDDQGQGDDDHNPTVNAQSCDTSALTPGTVVREASLNVSSAGAMWNKLKLVTSSTSTSSSSSSGD